MQTLTKDTIRFTREDIEEFAKISGDYNPMHICDTYARKSAYGRQIVYGMLCAIHGLRLLDQSKLNDITKINIEFINGVFLDNDYHISIEQSTNEMCCIKVKDDQKEYMAMSLSFSCYAKKSANRVTWEEEFPVISSLNKKENNQTAANDFTDLEFEAPIKIENKYSVDETTLNVFLEKWNLNSCKILVKLFSMCSYLIGMELPGKRATFTNLSFDVDLTDCNASDAMYYSLKTKDYDKNFRLITIDTAIACGNVWITKGTMRSFVKQQFTYRKISEDDLKQIASISAENRKIALVTGGSRGFGASLVVSLVKHGYQVILNYYKSEIEAKELAHQINEIQNDSVLLFQGDITKNNSCEELHQFIQEHTKQLHLLICNAALPPLSMKESESYQEINRKYYSTPVEYLADFLEESCGKLVCVSSAYVEKGPKSLNHYIEAKKAMETYVYEFATQHPNIECFLLRPNPLQTDMNNTPSGWFQTEDPNMVAEYAVSEIVDLPKDATNKVQIISEFLPHVNLGVSASFTIDALKESLHQTKQFLDRKFILQPAAYNQVLQELLNPNGTLYRPNHEINVILLRLCDWHRYLRPFDENGFVAREDTYTEDIPEFYENCMKEFLDAITFYREHTTNKTVIFLCPESRYYYEEKSWNALFQEITPNFIKQLRSIRGIHVIQTSEYEKAYGIEDIYDESSDLLGHIPFKQSYYTFLATLITRFYSSTIHKKPKVIVLDCDNTLWKGIVGEVGVTGISVPTAYQKWQEKLIYLTKHGWLLCLCSKNNKSDVFEVFEKREDMLLTLKDFVDYRINWNAKSENIKELATQLNLGLDSFLFFDDSSMECEEVRSSCSDVMTIEFPGKEEEILTLIDHLWLLDDFDPITKEDRVRTQFYQANAKREKLEASSSNFAAFLKNLNLNITYSKIDETNVERASQLTLRTNQFNFTTIRRNVEKLQELVKDAAYTCLSVQVTDKFGDYGQVGVVIGSVRKEEFWLDTFLLSCRVLGRNVEHQIIKQIAQIARDHKCSNLVILFTRTEKNQPAFEFLQRLTENFHLSKLQKMSDCEYICRFPIHRLLKLDITPKEISIHEKKDTSSLKMTQKQEDVRYLEHTMKSLLRKTEELFLQNHPERTTGSMNSTKKESGHLRSKSELRNDIIATIVSCTGMSSDFIDFAKPIEDFAWQSMKKIEISSTLVKKYSKLSLTFLYEYATLQLVLDFLVKEYGDDSAEQELDAVMAGTNAKFLESGHQEIILQTSNTTENNAMIETNTATCDIAIIGMDADFPGATNLSEFWDQLFHGICSVSEVPKNRWDSREYYSRDNGSVGKTHCKHGGFLKDFESFDHNFFGISAKEAMAMDPQQRLFLEVAYHAIENAGYMPETMERKTGVFVGAISYDFAMYLNEAANKGYSSYRWGDFYQLANRVSYCFNFHGPSMTIDSACSSSGTALYLACQSIMNHECETAVVGGVNLILHPSRYIQYSKMGLLTSDSTCYPFSSNAKGTIMGEGIGAVVIKPLRKAEADGDYIYGVIKGCAINSGGKTNGFTVPNPAAQKELIQSAIQKSKVDVNAIDYIEAHGTGTLIGDPIEMNGIAAAMPDKETVTHIGTVKGNIGHLESAATMAGLVKVLLQMKYGKLVPSVHALPLNPYLNFKDGKLAIQTSVEDWNSKINTVYAGISSFGAGGSNFHAIIASYPEHRPCNVTFQRFLILLSSKKEELLLQSVKNLYEFLQKEQQYGVITNENEYLARLAYTLQCSRRFYSHRIAIVVSSFEELLNTLKNMTDLENQCSNVKISTVEESNTVVQDFDEEEITYYKHLFSKGNLEKLASFWCLGIPIPLKELYQGIQLVKLPLPGYVFEKKRFELKKVKDAIKETCFYQRVYSPFVSAKCYELKIGLNEFPFLIDHQVNHTLIVPGAFPISLLLTTIANELQLKAFKLTDISWRKALILKKDSSYRSQAVLDTTSGSMCIYVDTANEEDETNWYLYTKGQLEQDEITASYFDINYTLNLCDTHLGKEEFYAYGLDHGFAWGKQFQCINDVWVASDYVVAKLAFSYAQKEASVFPASVFDACLQPFLYALDKHCRLVNKKATYIPFSIEELCFYGKIPEELYTYIDFTSQGQVHEEYFVVNVRMIDLTGKIICKLNGLRLKEVENGILDGGRSAHDSYLFAPTWTLQSVKESKSAIEPISNENTILWVDQRLPYMKLFSHLLEQPNVKVETFDFETIINETHLVFESKTGYERLIQWMKIFFQKVKDIAALYHDRETKFYLMAGSSTDAEEPVFEALAGMLKVLNSEDSKISVKMLTIDLQVSDINEIYFTQPENYGFVEYKVVGSDIYKKALLKTKLEMQNSSDSFLTKGDTCILIGGAGGIGFTISKYLAKDLGMNLIWIGRRAKEQCMDKIQEIEAYGTNLYYVQADATNYNDLATEFAKVPFDYTVSAVFQAAVILKDHLLSTMHVTDYQAVFDTKVKSMINLLDLLKEKEIGCLINISSESVFRGSPAQINYVSACRYLDSYLKMLGLQKGIPVRIMNWGYWGEVGVVATKDYAKRLKSVGLLPFSNEEGIDIFDEILHSSNQQVVALKMTELYQKHVAFFNEPQKISIEKTNTITQKIPVMSSTRTDEVTSSKKLPQATSLKEAKKKVTPIIEKELRNVLMMEEDEVVSKTTGFKEMGVDSLMAIQYRDSLEEATHLKLSSTIVYDYPNLETLVQYIAQTLIEKGQQEEKLDAKNSKITSPITATDSAFESEDPKITKPTITKIPKVETNQQPETARTLEDRISAMTEEEAEEQLMKELNLV